MFSTKGTHNIIRIFGKTSKLKLSIVGNNNYLWIENGAFVNDCTIDIRGNNNNIFIRTGVIVYEGELWIEDEGGEIIIGRGTTIQKAHLAVTESGKRIVIGDDCMLSTNVEIRTGDSHSIIDNSTGERINFGSDVILGNHVWIGSRAILLKGVSIGQNSVIGSGSIVTKPIPAYTLAVGIPARIIKSNVSWKRERI